MSGVIKTIGVFLLGVYVGQEYGRTIPNVRDKTVELYSEFQKTEFYQKLTKKK
jgi:hypothetical protein